MSVKTRSRSSKFFDDLLAVVAVGLVLGASLGCGQRRAPRAPTPKPAPREAKAIEPSPLLELVRSERFHAEHPPKRTAEGTSDVAEPEEVDHSFEDHEIREIRVKTSKFATWEDLARYALRNAEKRRPRRLHESRFLVRAEPTTDGSRLARAAARRRVRARRPEIKRCLIAAEARRPEVIIKAPSALVVEQAMGSGTVQYDFTVSFHDDGSVPSVTHGSVYLDDETRGCIGRALHSKKRKVPHVVMPVVAFAQPAYSPAGGGSALHAMLANQAAALGWLHYERGEYHEALAYFEDAYWIFHRVEYRVLVGMALEQLERPAEAAEAYADYLVENADAPDALELRAKVIKLRREAGITTADDGCEVPA